MNAGRQYHGENSPTESPEKCHLRVTVSLLEKHGKFFVAPVYKTKQKNKEKQWEKKIKKTKTLFLRVSVCGPRKK